MGGTTLRILCFVLCAASRSGGHSYCTGTYGRELCSFVPAPPGKTPPCALPGLTYCEHPEHYPGQKIQHLIQTWRFDHSTILVDETKDEFSSYHYPPPTYKYGPPNTLKPENFYPESFYFPKPNYLPPPPHPYNATFAGYPDRRPPVRLENYKYSNNIPPHQARALYGPSLALPQNNPYLKLWSRKDENDLKTIQLRRKREVYLRRLKRYGNGTVSGRSKRQSNITGQTLCESRSQYIMPRAGLNNKGSWKYIVNMPELDSRYTQLVKSETCVSQTCSGLCTLPLGYSSKCEQKYVQKRLVALQDGGNELYTDVFWFPSCCVCTLSNG